MADFQAKRVGEMETGFGGGFVKVRAELGVSSFGVQVIRLPPNYGDYPEHDHGADGQEEVYLLLDGAGRLEIEGERVDLAKDLLVRVGPGTKRKVFSGPDGLSMLVIGGVPGQVYEINPNTELSAA